MAATKKRRKRLTNAEKKSNKEFKREMQEKGVLPPDKKPLNRKKFALEVLKVVDSDDFNFYDYLPYLVKGFSVMMPYQHEGEILRPVTPEQIGVLKVFKIALEIKKFWLEKSAEGITEVEFREIYEAAIKPILDL